MKGILRCIGDEIVNPSRVLFRTNPSMDKPFVVPRCLQGGGRDSSDQVQNIRASKRNEGGLSPRSSIRICLAHNRSTKTEQNQCRIQDGLVAEIRVHVGTNVSTVADVTGSRI